MIEKSFEVTLIRTGRARSMSVPGACNFYPVKEEIIMRVSAVDPRMAQELAASLRPGYKAQSVRLLKD